MLTQVEREVMRAHADLRGEGITGEADFVEVVVDTQRYVRITVRIKGDPDVLRPGLHGMHIHEKGMCEMPFMSSGGHFDPGPAGNSDPDVNHPYHLGDLPNLRVDHTGFGMIETISTRITLSSGPLSILSGDGSALMIHGDPDQEISGPPKSGVSGGPRLACGPIRMVS